MRGLLALLLFFPGLTAAQEFVSIGLAPFQEEDTKQMLGKRAAKLLTVWLVVAENRTQEPLMLAESAVLGRMMQYGPLDQVAAKQIMELAAKRSTLARIGRGVMDASLLASFFGSAKVIQMGEKALIGLTGFTANAPYIVDRVKGADIPIMSNFEELCWREPLRLNPGESRIEHIFTGYRPQNHYNSFVIETSTVQKIKVIQ